MVEITKNGIDLAKNFFMSEVSQWIAGMPGIGSIIASAIVAA